MSGSVEREAAAAMIVRHSPGAQRITVGADKAFDTADFVADMRALNVTPHVAQSTTGRRSAIDGRTTRHSGYEISQQKRKRVEEPFGWGKTIGGLARPMLRGMKKLDFKFIWTMGAETKAILNRAAALRGQGYVSTLLKIQAAFEQAGIQFIDDDETGGFGLRMAKKKRKMT